MSQANNKSESEEEEKLQKLLRQYLPQTEKNSYQKIEQQIVDTTHVSNSNNALTNNQQTEIKKYGEYDNDNGNVLIQNNQISEIQEQNNFQKAEQAANEEQNKISFSPKQQVFEAETAFQQAAEVIPETPAQHIPENTSQVQEKSPQTESKQTPNQEIEASLINKQNTSTSKQPVQFFDAGKQIDGSSLGDYDNQIQEEKYDEVEVEQQKQEDENQEEEEDEEEEEEVTLGDKLSQAAFLEKSLMRSESDVIVKQANEKQDAFDYMDELLKDVESCWPPEGVIAGSNAKILIKPHSGETNIQSTIQSTGGDCTCVDHYTVEERGGKSAWRFTAIGLTTGEILLIVARTHASAPQPTKSSKLQEHCLMLNTPDGPPQQSLYNSRTTCVSFSQLTAGYGDVESGYLASGHANGHIYLWDISQILKPYISSQQQNPSQQVKVLERIVDAHNVRVIDLDWKVDSSNSSSSNVELMSLDQSGRIVSCSRGGIVSMRFISGMGRFRTTVLEQYVLKEEDRIEGAMSITNVPALQKNNVSIDDIGQAYLMGDRNLASQKTRNISQSLEGLFAIGSRKGVYVCRSFPVRNSYVIHAIIQPPQECQQEGSTNCVVSWWRRYEMTNLNLEGEDVPYAVLVVAWKYWIGMYTVPTHPKTQTGQAVGTKLLKCWTQPFDTIGLHCVDRDLIAVFGKQDSQATYMFLYDVKPANPEVIDSMPIQVPLKSGLHTSAVSKRAGEHNAQSSIMLIAPTGLLFRCDILSLEESISNVQISASQITVYNFDSWSKAFGLSIKLGCGALKSDRNMPRKLKIADLMKKGVLSCIQRCQTLQQEDENQSEKQQLLQWIAQIAIQLCFVLEAIDLRTSVSGGFLGQVFEAFQSVGNLDVFFELMEPELQRSSMFQDSVSAEMMQGLVNFYAARNELNKVESTVLHISYESLDLNQLFGLCLRHGLFTAYAYISQVLLKNFLDPFALMFFAFINEYENQQNREYLGYKCMVYAQQCMRGQRFPPGVDRKLSKQKRATFQDLTLEETISLKAQIVALLLYADKEWLMTTRKQLPGAAMELSSDNQDQKYEISDENIQDGKYMVLKQLLQLDSDAFLAMLREMLDGFVVSKCDVLAVLPENSLNVEKGAEGDALVSQLFISAIVQVVEGEGNMDDKSLDFLSEMVGKGHGILSSNKLLMLLRWLTSSQMLEKVLRQRRFMDIVVNVGIQHLGEEQNDIGFTRKDVGTILQLALDAQFWQAAATVHHLDKNYQLALQVFTNELEQPHLFFEYFSKNMREMPREKQSELKTTFLKFIDKAVLLDSDSAAATVLKYFDENEQQGMLEELQAKDSANSKESNLQFQFLKSLITATSVRIGQSSVVSWREGPPILQNEQTKTTYLKLLCQKEPSQVLNFIQNNGGYDIQSVKKFCMEFKVRDALAYLHEVSSEYQQSFQLHKEDMELSNHKFKQEILKLKDQELINVAQYMRVPLSITQQQKISLSRPSSPTPGMLSSSLSREVSLPKQFYIALQRAKKDANSTFEFCRRNCNCEKINGKATKLMVASQQEAEDYWFSMVNVFVQELRGTQEGGQGEGKGKKKGIGYGGWSRKEQEEEESVLKQGIIRNVFSQIVEMLVGNMGFYFSMQRMFYRLIMQAGEEPLGHLKPMIKEIFGAVTYEKTIREISRSIFKGEYTRLQSKVYGKHKRGQGHN